MDHPVPVRLRCADRVLELDTPAVMGVLNATPDSFYQGSRYTGAEAALRAAERMVEEGAAIIDIGGESTRPGAAPVATEEELRRVLPLVERVAAARLSAVLCVDTSNPQVMRRAEAAGAQMINDVRALRVDGALEVLAGSRMAVCLMHMQGEPATMQREPRYHDVVAEVRDYLAERIRSCVAAGIAPERLCIDPGFCFGKLLRHNLELLRRLQELCVLGAPVLVGLSRKSMAGALAARPGDGAAARAGAAAAMAAPPVAPPGERLAASLALASIAVLHGASIVRAHDVAATRDVVRVALAVRSGAPGPVDPPR